ncbi:MAG: helicase [Candidatus Viridilinea halotolerans]|uniref:Helicase n=1 Tax=Candidatus Viridilinea halotolerans TaxID=2491704 RepID=A0A426TUY3_9CHLR|nr:MAG: helicase [Candidatus Viridilinea halotolerans]
MTNIEVGALVRCRGRDWVVQAQPAAQVVLLRPLSGSEAEICGIFLPFEAKYITGTVFHLPDPAAAGDFVAGQLLRDAARLTLRSGAGPLRSLGRLQVRPRSYQLVPLLMALRLPLVRLLIADDVGIGKTIEAGLIARELFERGEIRSLAVLCPPHLCDQWQQELQEKFGFPAEVIRSTTTTRLEKGLPPGDVSLWEHYPLTVTSIDYVKSERRRASFLRAIPDLVIVDEAHTATHAAARGAGQQQRYELIREVALDTRRHLILLTATPHSGIEDAFRNLLGLLDPRFATLQLEALAEDDRAALARHFIQRRRADVRHWLNEDTPFPTRELVDGHGEVTYTLARSAGYRKLFDDVFAFTREIIRAGTTDGSSVVRQRARYWAALALLRCVMSSPAAAAKALRVRADALGVGPQSAPLPLADELLTAQLLSDFVLDASESQPGHDQEPMHVAEILNLPADDEAPEAEHTPPAPGRTDAERSRDRLRRLATRADALAGEGDPKLQALIPLLKDLLRDGFRPIVYCRYIATAHYLVDQLIYRLQLPGYDVRMVAVTGNHGEDERAMLIDELIRSPHRVLVATDCLSEGINLQHAFDAVVHYDLPWNPNRLEQREGRVDRYGQRAPTVRTALIYGRDNPMDEAVMRVLLRKAVSIQRSLGISVPLPVHDGTVINALIASLFELKAEQLALFDAEAEATLVPESALQTFEHAWDVAVEREKESRTRFAQRRIRPEAVAEVLEESDAALGDPATVESFVRLACERLGSPLAAQPQGMWTLNPAALPTVFRDQFKSMADNQGLIRLTFAPTAPVGVQSLSRTHPLVIALAEYLLSAALRPNAENPPAARSGLIITTSVSRSTVLLLLRIRFLISSYRSGEPPTLAEELVVTGYSRTAGTLNWLSEAEALELLKNAQPSENVTPAERSAAVAAELAEIPNIRKELHTLAQQHARTLQQSHQRVRAQTGAPPATVRVASDDGVDVLGVYLLWPE